jgi:hypothetical protein
LSTEREHNETGKPSGGWRLEGETLLKGKKRLQRKIHTSPRYLQVDEVEKEGQDMVTYMLALTSKVIVGLVLRGI